MKRFYKFIVAFSLVLLKVNASAQSDVPGPRQAAVGSGLKKILLADTARSLTDGAVRFTGSPRTAFSLLHFTPQPIRQNLYVQNFGFFCRQELQLEKATKIPLRVRLGSLQYTRKLEGYKL